MHLMVCMIIVCLHSLKWRLQKNTDVIWLTPPSLAPRIHLAQRKHSEICGWLVNKWMSVVLHGTRFCGTCLVMNNWPQHSPAFPNSLHYESFLTNELTLLTLTTLVDFHLGILCSSDGNDLGDAWLSELCFCVHGQPSRAGMDVLVRRTFCVNEFRVLEVEWICSGHYTHLDAPLRLSESENS